MSEPTRQPDARNGKQERGISNGPNARPLDNSIAQSAPGMPDNSSMPVEIDPSEEKTIEKKIREM